MRILINSIIILQNYCHYANDKDDFMLFLRQKTVGYHSHCHRQHLTPDCGFKVAFLVSTACQRLTLALKGKCNVVSVIYLGLYESC